MSDLTIENFKAIKKVLEKQRVRPLKVRNVEEAKEFTKNDPVGHKWEVGEAYYILRQGVGYIAHKSKRRREDDFSF